MIIDLVGLYKMGVWDSSPIVWKCNTDTKPLHEQISIEWAQNFSCPIVETNNIHSSMYEDAKVYQEFWAYEMHKCSWTCN